MHSVSTINPDAAIIPELYRLHSAGFQLKKCFALSTNGHNIASENSLEVGAEMLRSSAQSIKDYLCRKRERY
jgi:hypothetical protein